MDAMAEWVAILGGGARSMAIWFASSWVPRCRIQKAAVFHLVSTAH